MSSLEKTAPRSFRIRAFATSRRWVERIHNVCDATHQALWLGVLDADEWQELTDSYYQSSGNGSKSVDYHSEAFNLRGFFVWEREAVDAHFGDCKSILIGSAGGGREVVAAARRGLKVDAFECNPELLESCRSFLAAHDVAANVVAAKPNEVPEALATYDSAILGWGAYIHMVGRERRIGFLKALHRHVNPGGPLLLSFFVYRSSRPRQLTYRLARAIRTMRRAAPVERGDSLSSTFDHRFTQDEIRQELAAAGFEVVSYSEGQGSIGHTVARALSVAG